MRDPRVLRLNVADLYAELEEFEQFCDLVRLKLILCHWSPLHLLECLQEVVAYISANYVIGASCVELAHDSRTIQFLRSRLH